MKLAMLHHRAGSERLPCISELKSENTPSDSANYLTPASNLHFPFQRTCHLHRLSWVLHPEAFSREEFAGVHWDLSSPGTILWRGSKLPKYEIPVS